MLYVYKLEWPICRNICKAQQALMKTDVNLFEPFKHVSIHQYAHSPYAKRARLSLHLPNAYVLATLSAHASCFLLSPVVIVNQSRNNVVFDACRFEIKLRTNLT